MSTTYLSEIFASFQGEGLYVGEYQIFLRFAGCNLSCKYCDSPQALEIPKTFKDHNKQIQNNPIGVRNLLEIVSDCKKGKNYIHSVSITGGEPLLQVDFLKNFLPELKKAGNKTYLETNGAFPSRLEEIIESVDIVALDFKLPSSTGLAPLWVEHKKALEIAYAKEVFVKMVVTRETLAKEIDEAASIISSIDSEIKTIIQPVTPFGTVKHRPTPEEILSYFLVAKRKLKNVRVIPQMHKILGMA